MLWLRVWSSSSSLSAGVQGQEKWPPQPVHNWTKLSSSSTWASLRGTRSRPCTSGSMVLERDFAARPELWTLSPRRSRVRSDSCIISEKHRKTWLNIVFKNFKADDWFHVSRSSRVELRRVQYLPVGGLQQRHVPDPGSHVQGPIQERPQQAGALRGAQVQPQASRYAARERTSEGQSFFLSLSRVSANPRRCSNRDQSAAHL